MTASDHNNNFLDRDQVRKAVHAIFQYLEKKEKNDVFLEGRDIFVQLTFKRVPDVKNKIIKIHLPVTLMKETSDVCLFVKDLDKKKRDFDVSVDHFKDLLSAKGVTNITEVIPLKALKLEYQPYEAKRNLSNMYDFFLADERIVRLLPNLLGKNFYGRKRHPLSVDLQVTDLKHEIDRALATTRLIIGGRGSSCQVTVAHSAMTEEQVVDNILATAERLAETLPGGATNVRNVHLRLQDSPALPVYAAEGSVEDVTLPQRKRKLEEDEPEEISTLMDKKVKLTPEGEVLFYTMDGELCKPEKTEKVKKRRPKGKKNSITPKGLRVQSETTSAKEKKVGAEAPKKTSSKVMRLAPKDTKSDKKVTKQKKEQQNKQAKSLQKNVAAKTGAVKNKPKSKKLKL